MKMEEIRKLADAELATTLDDRREELFKLRFQWAIGQLTDTSRFKATKRDIARLLTVMRERELEAQE